MTNEVPPIPRGDQLAAMNRRFFAMLLDFVVLGIPTMMLLFPLALSGSKLTQTELLVGTAVTAALSGMYHTLCIRFWGKTVGKSATGCVVVRAIDGGPVDTWSAAIRALVPLVAGAIPAVGPFITVAVYVVAFTDPRRQGLHDKAAATLVVAR
jgi:uncharacterized RDD family membrane protein YckC